MKIYPSPEKIVVDIIDKLSSAIKNDFKHRDKLRKIAIQSHDWLSIGKKLISKLND